MVWVTVPDTCSNTLLAPNLGYSTGYLFKSFVSTKSTTEGRISIDFFFHFRDQNILSVNE